MKNLVLLLSILVLLSCSKGSDQSSYLVPTAVTTLLYDGKSFDVSKKADLKQVALLIAKKDGTPDPEILEYNFQEFKPLKGDPFKGVKAVYKSKDLYVTSVTPVTVINGSNSGARLLVDPKCTMKCNSSTFCQGCDMTINEQCKSLSCTCNKGSGDCDPSIEF